MIGNRFFGILKPRLRYEQLAVGFSFSKRLVESTSIILLLPHRGNDAKPQTLKVGDRIKTGQRLFGPGPSSDFIVSPATGTVSAVEMISGPWGDRLQKTTVIANSENEYDDQVKLLGSEPSKETLIDLLSSVPGDLPVAQLCAKDNHIQNLVVSCSDCDLRIFTIQAVVKSKWEEIKTGIKILRKLLDLKNIYLAVPDHVRDIISTADFEVTTVPSIYPAAHPKMIMKNSFGGVVPAGEPIEKNGFCFLSAEAVASIGSAYSTGELPVYKTVTLIAKSGEAKLLTARVGTSIRHILESFEVNVSENDRVILGGPMTGTAISSVEYPLDQGTDAIVVQSSGDLPTTTDISCINCGECVRSCPSRLPVNLLIRSLEFGKYEDAKEKYDLNSCIECGMCSYVCTSGIPIFQHITLAKHKLAQSRASEVLGV